MRRFVLLFLLSSLFMTTTPLLCAQAVSAQQYCTPGPAQQQFGKVRSIDPSNGNYKVQKVACTCICFNRSR
jgi:hypothetical protein